MEALVWQKWGVVEYIDNWPEPNMGVNDVRVRVRAAGVCATDIHMVRGLLQFGQPPWVLGHEVSGVVDRVGAAVSDWKAGDRVVVDPVVSCGRCASCRTGAKHLCLHGGELGTNIGTGGYGEFVVAPAENLYHLPKGMSFVEGALAEPLDCIVGAVERVPNLTRSRVLIFGAGPAGLMFAQVCRAYGARSVTVVDPDGERLEVARAVGVDRTICKMSHKLSDPGDVEVAIDAAGTVDTVKRCFEFVRPGGTVALYGIIGSAQPTISSDAIIAKDLTIVTSTSAPLRWIQAIDLIAEGRVSAARMIVESSGLGHAAEAINAAVRGDRSPLKMVIVRNDG